MLPQETGVFAPLSGRLVVDFSTLIPGPYAGLLLAQLGARVVKVEPPTGDPGRRISPHVFAQVNAGKESMVLDVKSEQARPALSALLRRADVVLVSSLPATLARLGLDAATVSDLNPAAVYCDVLGWSGPLSDLPAHDIDVFAGSGAIHVSPETDFPLGLPFADLATGALAALQVVAALVGDRTEPTRPAPSLAVSMASVLQSWVAIGAKVSTRSQLQEPPAGPPRIGGYGIFRAADGRRLSIGAVEDRFWKVVVRECGLPKEYADLSLTERREGEGEINRELAERLESEDAATWVTRLRHAGVPAAPVATLAEAFTPEAGGDAVRVLADGRLGVILPSGLPSITPGPAPELGSNTEDILGELGVA